MNRKKRLKASTYDELDESNSPVGVDHGAGLLVVHVVGSVADIPAEVCSLSV
jgi:hypothetical protein